MWSPSYGCFSAGMRDECIKTLIHWQEGPLGYIQGHAAYWLRL